MRWRFIDRADAVEVAAREEVLRKMDAWWEEFGRNTENLRALFDNKTKWDLPAWMDEHLHAVHPELMWEFGPAVKGEGHRLVITPESRHELRPMVEVLLARAPKLEGWDFFGYRLAEDLAMAQQMVAARVEGDLAGTEVTASVGHGNRIDVCFYSPTTTGESDKRALHCAFVAIETLLGEEILDKWIGGVEVKAMPRKGIFGGLFSGKQGEVRRIPLERLRPTVEALVGSVKEQLPKVPWWAWGENEDTQGVVMKLKPTKAEEYPEREDLFVAVSRDEKLWRGMHGGGIFCSERFSAHGEVFCYLKLDGTQGLDEEKFEDRAEIEDALDEVLIPSQAGRVVGGGTGWKYSYIDLAMADLEKGIPLIMERLRAGNISDRTWLKFFDADLGGEWVGVYEGGPKPPGVE